MAFGSASNTEVSSTKVLTAWSFLVWFLAVEVASALGNLVLHSFRLSFKVNPD
jgi:hypothetical protein